MRRKESIKSDIGLFDDIDPYIDKVNSEKPKELERRSHRRTTEVIDITQEDEYRRAFGAQELLRLMGLKKPEKGHSIHIISGGNVDLICHVKWLILHFPIINKIFISAWAISASDIVMLRRWIEKNVIKDVTLLVGDIFPSQYKCEWKVLIDLYNRGLITNLYSSKIHSKLILIETQDKEYICVESSANCNMNPRIEQSVVTMNEDLYRFYIDYFDEVFYNERMKRVNIEMQNLDLTTEPEDADSNIPEG